MKKDKMKDDEVLGKNHYFSLFDMVFYEKNIAKYCFYQEPITRSFHLPY